MSSRLNVNAAASRPVIASEPPAGKSTEPSQKALGTAFRQPERMVDSFVPASRKHHKPPQPGPNPQPPPNSGGLPNLPGRPKYVTEIDAQVTIDKYSGIQHGRNGDHEIAEGHITKILQVGNQKVIDTQKVHLAMNVKSARDPNGLPREIPLKPGQTIEVEGEYIPKSHATGSNGAAVLHFTHAPGGFVVIDGKKYQ